MKKILINIENQKIGKINWELPKEVSEMLSALNFPEKRRKWLVKIIFDNSLKDIVEIYLNLVIKCSLIPTASERIFPQIKEFIEKMSNEHLKILDLAQKHALSVADTWWADRYGIYITSLEEKAS